MNYVTIPGFLDCDNAGTAALMSVRWKVEAGGRQNVLTDQVIVIKY